MPYIIDGHNLIGRMQGIGLRQLDDEEQLIRQVLEFCSAAQKQAEIYFDNASPGFAGRRKRGRVTAIFVASGQTADSAILRRLKQLKRAARNWTVVSSDRQVQAEARAAGAAILDSGEFAGMIEANRAQQIESGETTLDESEIAEWLAAFGGEDED